MQNFVAPEQDITTIFARLRPEGGVRTRFGPQMICYPFHCIYRCFHILLRNQTNNRLHLLADLCQMHQKDVSNQHE